MTDVERCECGRPKYTAADLKRWQDELEASGSDERAFNPEWAKPICWTVRDQRCGYKRLEPTP